MPKFTIKDILLRVGGTDHFQRVLGLQARLTKRSAAAVAARVGSPFDSVQFDVMVSTDLEGRCPCTIGAQGSFCDHAAAAALEWILEGSDHGSTRGFVSKLESADEPTPFKAVPLGRFS